MSLVSFRTSRGPLFDKPVSWLGLFLTVSYSKPALDDADESSYNCTLLYFTLIFCLKSYSELKSGETRQISIRDGTEFHESLEVRRLWRDNRFDPNSKEKYFDIAILELGKDYCH